MNARSNYPRLAMLIGDAWIGSEARASESVLNPATEAVLGRVPFSASADLDAALQAAEAAFPLWRAKGPRERARILKTGADLVRQRAEAMALTMTLEQGKPLAEAKPPGERVHIGRRPEAAATSRPSARSFPRTVRGSGP